MSYVIKRVSQFPKNKIIDQNFIRYSSLRIFLSRTFDVAPQNVYAPVIGEHGDSQVAVWSHAQIAGEPVLDLLNKGVDQTTFKQSIASQTTPSGI